MRYVAFLRGINVGGNKRVPMADLKSCLEKAGFANVKTLLNSGNVAFDAPSVNETELAKILEQKFGFPIGLTTRTQNELKTIVKSDPFKDVDPEKNTRYVTFLTGKPGRLEPMPFSDSEIIGSADGAIFWRITKGVQHGTLDVMSYLDKTFGKDITTRNYNTVLKAAEL